MIALIRRLARNPFPNAVSESYRATLNDQVTVTKAAEIAVLDEQEALLETAWGGIAALSRVLDATENADLTTFDPMNEREISL
jgi:hypothetical protein